MSVKKRNWLGLWQAAYLLSATTWLFAPYLNDQVSGQSTSISQYIIPYMPYAWIFRTGEFIAGLLLLFVAAKLYATYRHLTIPVGLLSLIGVVVMIDLLIPASCQLVADTCHELGTEGDLLHGIESLVGYVAVIGLAVWDIARNNRLSSKLFLGVQIILSAALMLNAISTYSYTTFLQFSSQFLAIVWTAWFVAMLFGKTTFIVKQTVINKVVGALAGLLGMAAVAVGVFHIDSYTNGTYFGLHDILVGDYGIVAGAVMLYLARQLWRGERRAWQLLLVLLGLEIIKYSVIVPNPVLLLIPLITFTGVFVVRDHFSRGMMPRTRKSRAVDAYVLIGGAAVALVVGLANNRLRAEASIVIAAAIGWFVLWALFRPARSMSLSSRHEIEEAEALVVHYAGSTEDLFKLWPEDKKYFWLNNREGFIAYKVVGPIAFALADPVAVNRQARSRLLKSFINHCRLNGWRVCFLLVSEESVAQYQKSSLHTLQIGSSAVIDIKKFASTTATNKWWRWQRNKGRRMNYQYEVLEGPHPDSVMRRLKFISDEWMTRGGHQEEGFAMGYFNESYLQRCRLHILRNEQGDIVAFVNQLQTFNGLPQTTIDLIRFVSDAPNANNFLLYSMILRLDEENEFTYFDLGFVPLAQMRGKLANVVRRLGAERFSASGLEQFKGKFDPEWKVNYFAYDGDLADAALIALHLEEAMKP